MTDALPLFVIMMMVLVLTVLVLVLAIQSSSLKGRNWLVAGTALTVVAETGFKLLAFLDVQFGEAFINYGWYETFDLVYPFATACIAVFLFANWSWSRMDLDMRHFLFSFSGRIPRSAFWVALCVLVPLTNLTVLAIFNSTAEGLPMALNYMMSIVWVLASTWIAFAVYAKRWHDCSKSGWMTLVMVVPIIGPLWALGYLGFVRGADGPNQYDLGFVRGADGPNQYDDNPIRTRQFPEGAWMTIPSIFYRSIFQPRDIAIGSEQITGQRYFFYLCGLYLCLPVATIFAISYIWELLSPATAPMDRYAAPMIGIQVVALLPLLFVSNWLLAKIVVRRSAPGQEKETKRLFWLLASNFFFMLGTPLAIGVIIGTMANLGRGTDEILGLLFGSIWVALVVLWFRSAVVLIQLHRDCTRLVAFTTALIGAAAILLMAWLTIGVTFGVILALLALLAP